jgi:hypothetical protein
VCMCVSLCVGMCFTRQVEVGGVMSPRVQHMLPGEHLGVYKCAWVSVESICLRSCMTNVCVCVQL